MEARAVLSGSAMLAALLLFAPPGARALTQCQMPNGVTITLNHGNCPADAKPIDPATGQPAARPAGKRSPEVNAVEFGAQWPFTVRSGRLGCQRHPSVASLQLLTFTAGEKTYALNGLAGGLAPKYGWLSVKEIWRSNEAIAGTKVPLGTMIERAQAICP